jgi:hypothetical protein
MHPIGPFLAHELTVAASKFSTCRHHYTFGINISNRIVSLPNLPRFTGRVTTKSLVRASVTVQDKYAAGSGKLTNISGKDTWKGRSGTAPDIGRCKDLDSPAVDIRCYQ